MAIDKFLNKWPLLPLFIAFVIGFFAYKIPDVLPLRPQSTHSSRQADCASYTLNYYQNNVPFFKPQQHNRLGIDGHAVSEFPIFYYAVAQLYRILGPHEWVMRLTNLIIFLIAVYYLLQLSRALIPNIYLAYLTPLLVFTSPYLIYYAANFLVNITSLSFAIFGWYCFFKYIQTDRMKWWVWCFVWFTLGSLLKFPAAISYGTIIGVIFLNDTLYKRLLPQSFAWKRQLAHYGLFALFLGLNAAWIMYARWFNGHYGNGSSLLSILPIWTISLEEAYLHWSWIEYFWLKHYHVWQLLYIIAGMGILLIPLYRIVDRVLGLATLFLALGYSAYIVLWFPVFFVHDYYLINWFILPTFIVLTFSEMLYRVIPWEKAPGKHVAIPALLMVALFFFGAKNVDWRQNDRFYSEMNSETDIRHYTITPYLREIGIDRNALVVSVPDDSPTRSLYLLNNHGWTGAYQGEVWNINYFRHIKGAEFLIMSDSALLNDPLYRPHITKQIGEYQGILIFDLRD